MNQSIYAIGDAHSNGQELLKLTEICELDSEVYLLGDWIDRGLYSHLIWDWLQQPNHRSILGNHCIKMMHYLQNTRKWIPEYYHWALDNLGRHGISREKLLTFLEKCPILVEKEVGDRKWLLVHGGIDLEQPNRENLSINVYNRHDDTPYFKSMQFEDKHCQNWWDKYDGEYKIAYGHTVNRENGNIRIRHNSFGLDTGACHGNELSMLRLNDQKVFQYKSGIDWFSQLKTLIEEEKTRLYKLN